MRVPAIIIASICLLAGCVTVDNISVPMMEGQENGKAYIPIKDSKDSGLSAWWAFFEDPVLDGFVDSALSKQHFAKVAAEKTEGDYYRKPELQTVLAVVRTYLEYRFVQSQKAMLLEYIYDVKNFGDGAMSSGLPSNFSFDALFKQKEELEKKEQSLYTELSSQSNLLPEYVHQVLKEPRGLPAASITPVLVSSAQLMTDAVDVKKARMKFVQVVGDKSLIGKTEKTFSDMMLGSFFGIADHAYVEKESLWRVSIGQGVKNISFEAIDYDMQKGKGSAAYKADISSYVMDVEHALVSFSQMKKQYKILQEAALKNEKSKASGFSSYNQYNETRLAALKAHYEMLRIMVDLYETLGVY